MHTLHLQTMFPSWAATQAGYKEKVVQESSLKSSWIYCAKVVKATIQYGTSCFKLNGLTVLYQTKSFGLILHSHCHTTLILSKSLRSFHTCKTFVLLIAISAIQTNTRTTASSNLTLCSLKITSAKMTSLHSGLLKLQHSST